ncbi:MAG: hypothetical protein U0166_27550 [Acidobacteriota bacterium]
MSCFVKIKTRITDHELFAEGLRSVGYGVERREASDTRGDVVYAVTCQARGRAVSFDASWREGEAVRLLGDNQVLTDDRVGEIHRVYAEGLIVREAKARGFTGIERRVVAGEVVLTVRKWVA